MRHERYWEQQLASQIYVVIPCEFSLTRYPAQGALEGYVISSVRTREEQDPTVQILEVAGTSEGAARQALLGLEDEAARADRPIAARGSAEHPLLNVFRQMGFAESLRHTMIMGQPLDPAGLFAKVCTDADLLKGLKIDFWAPFGDGTLHEGANAKTEITLEGKDEVIYRLLNRRLDIRAAVATELLTIRNGTADIVERLADALPYSPWVYHAIDYV